MFVDFFIRRPVFATVCALLIVLGAAVFLHERLNWRGWAGVGLTCVGVLLVSAS